MGSRLVLFFIAFGGILLFAAFFLWRRFMARRGLISRSFNLGLIAVRFPRGRQKEELAIQQLREKIGLMEQFYTHLGGMRGVGWRSGFSYGAPVASLEINIPAVGEELSFYVAVNRKFVPALEKVIEGIFPEAVVEPSQDYNIFSPASVAAGARLRLKKSFFYPVRTYQQLEGDPIRAVTNAFTKLAHEGEGAALQIVLSPARKKWRNIAQDRVRDLYAGKSISERESGFTRSVGVLTDIAKTLKETPSKNPEEERRRREDEERKRRLIPAQEQLAQAVERKAGKTLFETNVRLIAAAATADRAQGILGELGVAFEQFADSNLNAFEILPVAKRSLKELIFDFSFRNFNPRFSMILGTEELASIYHFQNVPIETPGLKEVRAREATAPPNLPNEGLILGYNMFRGEQRMIRMLDDDRRRHLYIIGQTGTGKSVFMKNMVIQDIEEGHGVCVIDPHGDMVHDLLGFIPRHRAQDVIYFNPGDVERPMGMNILEYDPNFPEQKTFVVNELLSIFIKLFGEVPEAIGPIFQQYFRNATLLVLEDPASGSTILEIGRVLADKAFRDLKLSRSRNIVVNQFWTEIAEKAGGEGELRNMVPYIVSKTDNFVANEIMRPIVAQQRSAFNFREVMDNRKILLVNLSKGRLGELNSSFIGLIVVGKLLMASLSRADEPEARRKDFYLYIDEFQNVTTSSIATILSEARKYRLDLVITHQFIGQLTEDIKKAVFGNVGSMVSFRIGTDDAEFMEKQYAPTFSAADLLHIENASCYVKLLMKGATSPAFSMKTYPPRTGNEETAEIIREISRTKYGKPREEVEADILRRINGG